VETTGEAPVLVAGTVITLVTWNLQFGGGRARQFFYEGGAAVDVPARDVGATLSGIAGELEGVDVALVQEVDRGSDRTGRIDELAALPYSHWASAPCHRAFVPYPRGRWLGRVEMHQAILSRWALASAERVALPEMEDRWYRRPFNLRRCMLTARLQVRGASDLWIANVHASAFTGADDSLRRQCWAVADWMSERECLGQRFLVAGDFNCGPPGMSGVMAGRPSPWSPLRGFRRLGTDSTYQPFGECPAEALDHVFVSRDLAVEGTEVRSTEWSDHLPIRARIRL
jgi:endonuclease/exonuclease/phosphatase family metal-dependent hydrolase